MTTVLLAVLGWFAVSILATAGWAAVCAGSRKGAAQNVAAWQRPGYVAPAFLPSPRETITDASVAV